MKKWQKALTMALAGAGCFMTYAPLDVQAAAKTVIQQADKQGLQRVTAITSVYGDGEKVAAAILEYPQDIEPDEVNVADFSATGKEIAKAYVNNQPQTSNTSRLERYIILEFAHQNSASDQHLGQPGQGAKQNGQDNNGKNGNDAPRRSNRKLPDLTLEVKQVGPIRAFDGTEYPSCEFIASTSTQEPDIAKFKQYSYTDSTVGATIPYNLYLPANYDAHKKYPLLFFVADASANINAVTTPLFQGNGATVWASDSEQAKHECIVLAPQYTADLVEQLGMLTTDENVWTPGLTLVSDLLFDVIDRYSVDKDRIYGTGQSQGGMTNIAISDKYPDLFSAQWLVACQWNVEEMAALKDKKLWITVCEGDTKAFPGMNSAVSLWESLGSKVARNKEFWNSHAPVAEINANARELAGDGIPINYTVFAGGNHMYTWSFAYDIEAIRDWLFAQRKDTPVNNQHSTLARSLQDAGVAAYKAGDYSKALQNFYAANAKGHMKAPRYIGLCYENGYGVKPDAKEAAKWYEKAFSRGDITSTYYLGRLYELGKGVAQDYGKAVELYRQSAQRDDIIAAPAMAALGRMYENGWGVAKDLDTAQMWYDKAKATGYTK